MKLKVVGKPFIFDTLQQVQAMIGTVHDTTCFELRSILTELLGFVSEPDHKKSVEVITNHSEGSRPTDIPIRQGRI